MQINAHSELTLTELQRLRACQCSIQYSQYDSTWHGINDVLRMHPYPDQFWIWSQAKWQCGQFFMVAFAIKFSFSTSFLANLKTSSAAQDVHP